MMKLEDLQEHTKNTTSENNIQNNKNAAKQHYEDWIKFKNELFEYLWEIIKIGKIKSFYCNNCQQEKDTDDINIYNLFLDLVLIKLM